MGVLLVLTGILLTASAGCGGGEATAEATGYRDFTVTSTMTEAHTHDFIIPGKYLENPPVEEKKIKCEFIVGGPLWHTLVLTPEDFVNLAQGGMLTIETSFVREQSGHTHQCIIRYPYQLPE